MEIKHVSNFIRVVLLGSMSEAARQLDISPAAVAQQMRALERDLGVNLLVRQGRNVKPTAAGNRLFEKGQALIHDFEALHDWVTADEERGKLQVGSVNTALHGFLPDVLQLFAAQHQGVYVSVRVGTTPDLYAALAKTELDLAICLKPAFELPKAVSWIPLREEPLVVLCQTKDRHKAPLALLRSRPLIRYDRQLAGGKLAERYLRTQEIQAQAWLELNSVIAIALMVERGLGIGLVPDIGDALIHGRKLSKLPLPSTQKSRKASSTHDVRQLGILWMPTSPRARWIRRLIECAQYVCGPR